MQKKYMRMLWVVILLLIQAGQMAVAVQPWEKTLRSFEIVDAFAPIPYGCKARRDSILQKVAKDVMAACRDQTSCSYIIDSQRVGVAGPPCNGQDSYSMLIKFSCASADDLANWRGDLTVFRSTATVNLAVQNGEKFDVSCSSSTVKFSGVAQSASKPPAQAVQSWVRTIRHVDGEMLLIPPKTSCLQRWSNARKQLTKILDSKCRGMESCTYTIDVNAIGGALGPICPDAKGAGSIQFGCYSNDEIADYDNRRESLIYNSPNRTYSLSNIETGVQINLDCKSSTNTRNASNTGNLFAGTPQQPAAPIVKPAFLTSPKGISLFGVFAGAWYGTNCKRATSVSPETFDVASTCNGKQSCSYRVDAQRYGGDRAPSCAKDFTVKWRCDGVEELFSASIPPEANGKTITLNCPATQVTAPVVQTNWKQPVSIGAWKVFATYQNGQFDGCAAATQGAGGVLVVGKTSAGPMMLVFSAAGQLGAGKVSLRTQINNGTPYYSTAEIASNGDAVIQLPASNVFSNPVSWLPITQYQVWVNNQPKTWQLANTKEAMDAVTQCYAASKPK